MMIFINGSINTGKTTIARILASKIPNTANIEVDRFHEFIPWLEIDDAVELNLENAASVIRNFAKHGYNIIVPYPLSEKNYENLKSMIGNINVDFFFFTLSPSIHKAQSDTSERKLSQWERDRIQHHYNIGIPNPTFGTIIDNTHQTPDETAEEILSRLPIHT